MRGEERERGEGIKCWKVRSGGIRSPQYPGVRAIGAERKPRIRLTRMSWDVLSALDPRHEL